MFASSKLITITLLIASIAVQGISSETPVRKCSNDKELPLVVQVDKCTEMPCDLWKGSDSQMIIQFVADRDSITHLTAEVHMTTLGVQIPFELEEESTDVCQNLLFGAYCPLYKDEDVTFKLTLPIADHLPEVPTKLEVSLRDTISNNIVSCFVLDGRVRRH